jgi:hypothetical protein
MGSLDAVKVRYLKTLLSEMAVVDHALVAKGFRGGLEQMLRDVLNMRVIRLLKTVKKKKKPTKKSRLGAHPHQYKKRRSQPKRRTPRRPQPPHCSCDRAA